MPETLGIVSQNLLLDKTHTEEGLIEPQHKRVDAICQALGSLPVALDVVMLQELHITKNHHNGERILENLDLEQGYWFNHNSLSRKNEYLGVCGNKIQHAEAFKVGDDRRAMLAIANDIPLIGIHNRTGIKKGPIRVDQIKEIVGVTRSFSKAAVVGDLNDHSRSESARLLYDEGFVPVFRYNRSLFPPNLGLLPHTFPTKEYRHIMLKPHQRRIAPLGFAIDVILLKGFTKQEVLQAGARDIKKADHKTLYAELAA